MATGDIVAQLFIIMWAALMSASSIAIVELGLFRHLSSVYSGTGENGQCVEKHPVPIYHVLLISFLHLELMENETIAPLYEMFAHSGCNTPIGFV